jgi:CBS domain-containing protein
MRAQDIMSDGVLSVAADATLLEAAKLLVNCRISAMPVVNDAGVMIGIVSETDLVRAQHPERPPQHPLASIAGDPQAAAAAVRASSRKVADVMTRDVLVATEDTPLTELARLMMERRVRRLPIVRNGAVVGIVSHIDLLRALIALESPHDKDSAKFSRDGQLRKEIAAACNGRSWSLAKQLDVVVRQGVAHLWGIAPSDMVRKAYRVAAENVPGVKGVEVHMHVVPPAATRVGL